MYISVSLYDGKTWQQTLSYWYPIGPWEPRVLEHPLEFLKIKVTRARRETTPVCSRLTRLVRAEYSRHDSGASRERARIMQRAQDGSVHMQRSLPASSYPAPVDFNPPKLL